ncbi:MAG: NMD3-related protein [Thermoplasmataceae archaeon]
MKCILCGKKESVEKGLCEDCLFKSVYLSYNRGEEVVICPKCDAVKIGKKWYHRDSETSMKRILSAGIRVNGMVDSDLHTYFQPFNLISDHMIHFSSRVTTTGGISHIFPGDTILKKTFNSCPECNKKTGSYYEAVVQIRSSYGQYDPSVDDAVSIALSIEHSLEKKHANSFVSKIEKKPEGIDIFLGRKNDAMRIVKSITETRPASLVVTKSLSGRKEGEDFYRFTYGIRILSLTEGSVISTREGTFLIRSVGKEITRVTDINSGKDSAIKSEALLKDDYKVLEKKLERKRFIVVSRDGDETQLMDPDGFKLTTLRVKADSQDVYLYQYNDRLF